MQFQQNTSIILLIGDDLNDLERIAFALEKAGNRVITADDGCEGFLTAQRERPDLIISQTSLSDISGLELCQLIRSDGEIASTPFLLFGDMFQGDLEAVDILHVGADDYLSYSHDLSYLITKVEWLIRQKRSENNLKQHCQILRRRQIHIADIIQETSDLMRNMECELALTDEDEFSCRESKKLFYKKIELGINMVDSLAHLLEEQVNALEIYERTTKGEEFIAAMEADSGKTEYDYYEIIS